MSCHSKSGVERHRIKWDDQGRSYQCSAVQCNAVQCMVCYVKGQGQVGVPEQCH